MDRDTMVPLFEAHRAAEARRDFDAILATFVELRSDLVATFWQQTV